MTDEWVYGHLSEILCKVGDVIKAGDVIGKMGNSGFVVSSQNSGGFWKYNPYAGKRRRARDGISLNLAAD